MSTGGNGRRRLLGAAPGLARSFLEVRRARTQTRAPACLPLLSVEITQECNARCGMCGYPSHYPRAARELTPKELRTVVDDARGMGTQVISLGGGEPFLRPDADAIVEHIDQSGITPFVHTNGSMLTPERCQRLANVSGMVLALSLDSHRREVHDRIRGIACFDSLIAAARFFVAEAPHVRVVFTFTVTAQNYRHMSAAARLASDLGVRSIRFTPVHQNLQHRHMPRLQHEPFALKEQHLAAVVEETERVLEHVRATRMVSNSAEFLRAIPQSERARVPHQCFAGFFFCSIDPYGNVFPCYDHVGAVNLRDYSGLRAAFSSPGMDQLRRQVVGCAERCWNVGTAEPSLRLNRRFLLRQVPHLVRESLFFRA